MSTNHQHQHAARSESSLSLSTRMVYGLSSDATASSASAVSLVSGVGIPNHDCSSAPLLLQQWPAVVSSASLVRTQQPQLQQNYRVDPPLAVSANAVGGLATSDLAGVLGRTMSVQSTATATAGGSVDYTMVNRLGADTTTTAPSPSEVSSLPPDTRLGPVVAVTAIGMNRTIHPKSEKASGDKKRTWKKPEGKPKRPLSAYNLFFQAERESMVSTSKKNTKAGTMNEEWGDFSERDASTSMAKRPRLEASSSPTTATRTASMPEITTTGSSSSSSRPKKGVSFAGLARSISTKWKSLDEAARAPFEALAVQDKTRYVTELTEWEKSDEAKSYKARRVEAAKTRRRERTLEQKQAAQISAMTATAKGGGGDNNNILIASRHTIENGNESNKGDAMASAVRSVISREVFDGGNNKTPSQQKQLLPGRSILQFSTSLQQQQRALPTREQIASLLNPTRVNLQQQQQQTTLAASSSLTLSVAHAPLAAASSTFAAMAPPPNLLPFDVTPLDQMLAASAHRAAAQRQNCSSSNQPRAWSGRGGAAAIDPALAALFDDDLDLLEALRRGGAASSKDHQRTPSPDAAPSCAAAGGEKCQSQAQSARDETPAGMDEFLSSVFDD